MLKELQKRIFRKGKFSLEDKEELEYLIWLNQSKHDFYEKNPFYSGERHIAMLRDYRTRVIAARAALSEVLELEKQES